MAIPTSKEINTLRVSRFKEMIQKAATPTEAGKEVFNLFEKLINECAVEHGLSPIKIAAGLAHLAQGERPFFVSESSERMLRMDTDRGRRERGGDSRDFRDTGRPPRDRFGDRDRGAGGDARRGGRRGERGEGIELGDPRREKETFRVEVGRIHGVKAGNLVGAVANEIGLNSDLIGQIKIHHDFSTIDLPAGMPREVFKTLGKAWVLGRQLRISKLMDHPSERRFSREKRGAR
jgi:ATP-dependent RNA helicase DeaD